MHSEYALKALLAAVRMASEAGSDRQGHHRPLDQGSQYSSYDWQYFLKSHNLEASMIRRGDCHNNAVAESFFQLLKRERIKKVYSAANGK